MLKRNNQLIILLILSFVVFLDSFGNFITLPIILKILYQQPQHFFHNTIATHGLNEIYSLLIVSTAVIGLIAAPLIGIYSDFIGRKWLILLLLVLSVGSYAIGVFGIFISSIWFILLLKALQGLSANSQPLAEAAITDILAGRKRALGYALIAGSMVFAMALGPLIGSVLSNKAIYSYFNLSTPLYLAIILSVLAIIAFSFLLQKKGQLNLFHNDQEKFNVKIITTTIIQFAKNTKLMHYFAIFFCMQFSWALLYQGLPLYFIEKLHSTANMASYYLFIVSMLMGVCLLLGYPLITKFTKITMSTMVGLSIFICLISSILFAISHSFISLYLFGSIVAITTGLYYPALVTMMSNNLQSNKYGFLMGINTILMNVAWLVSGAFVGLLANININSIPYLQIGFVLLSTLLILNLKRINMAKQLQYIAVK